MLFLSFFLLFLTFFIIDFKILCNFAGSKQPPFFNGSEWVINASENATVQVVDVMGRIVVSTNGVNTVATNGLTAGVYMLRLVDGNNVKTQKIVVE